MHDYGTPGDDACRILIHLNVTYHARLSLGAAVHGRQLPIVASAVMLVANPVHIMFILRWLSSRRWKSLS